MDRQRVAPLLCAGITTWSPLQHWQVGPGRCVAVVGLGGLGHMGVKLAAGLGAEIAHEALLSSKLQDSKVRSRFAFILDTIPVPHDLAPYLGMLRRNGALVVVGAVDVMPGFNSRLLLAGRRTLARSAIGGIEQTRALLQFCAARNILPECELIPIQYVNHAYERMQRGDVKYRFVIEMSSLTEVSKG